MNASIPLHWSFDYNQGAQNPEFAQKLLKTLRGYDTESDTRCRDTAAVVTHVYEVLPNFWRGYKRATPREKTLCIGTAIVERQKDDGDIWNYSVRYENTTSGEDVRLKFRCADEDYRPLTDRWHVGTQNSGDDVYSSLTCDGYLTLNAEIRLRINATEIVAGIVNDALPLTCNWALFDVIPALADTIQTSAIGVNIALLDDLEQFRPKNRLGFLESIHVPIPLDGYYLYGTGVLPSYWWLDSYGNVAIVSSVFETLVLKEKRGHFHG